ncbi:Plasmodium vivax Vir protein, putative [Plasmodium ovale]|uniref:Plasmodium vivax Vir protein, putative n=1 Tax=Plasmodium ovale TaxID=36330 RepID=A0A1C3KFD8_PLAOA|nr:Plasmodium vivax Vir protein, putative [Plasmodium ovale]
MNDDFDMLNTKIEYRSLDRNSYISPYSYCESLEGKLVNNNDIYSLCNQFLRNYEKIYNDSDPNTHDEEKCRTLNYWLFDAVIKRFSEKIVGNISSSDIIRELDNVWKRYNYKHTCNFYIYNLSEEKFNKMKTLYDYARDFHTINHRINESQKKCTEDYYNYIEDGKNYHTYFSSICSQGNSHEGENSYICKELDYINKINNETKFPYISCQKTTKGETQDGEHGAAREVLGSHTAEHNGRHVLQGDQEMSHMRAKLTDEDAELSPSGFITHIFVTTAFPLIAVLLIIFIFYKFTPFGPLIRTLIRRKKEMYTNLYEKAVKQFQKPMHDDTFSQDSPLNIQYHSSRNS